MIEMTIKDVLRSQVTAQVMEVEWIGWAAKTSCVTACALVSKTIWTAKNTADIATAHQRKKPPAGGFSQHLASPGGFEPPYSP